MFDNCFVDCNVFMTVPVILFSSVVIQSIVELFYFGEIRVSNSIKGQIIKALNFLEVNFDQPLLQEKSFPSNIQMNGSNVQMIRPNVQMPDTVNSVVPLNGKIPLVFFLLIFLVKVMNKLCILFSSDCQTDAIQCEEYCNSIPAQAKTNARPTTKNSNTTKDR